MLSKESISNYSSLSKDIKDRSFSFPVSYSWVRTIKDYTSDQKVHDQPTIMCGTNVHIERSRTRESMTRARRPMWHILQDTRDRSIPQDTSQRFATLTTRKPRRCFRSPLTGKSGDAKEDGKRKGDAHDVPIFTKIFRKQALRGNDERKFRLPLYRMERLPWYHAIMSVISFQ